MGCDIHFYVEKKVNGEWVSADKATPNPYKDEDDTREFSVSWEDRFYSNRNYTLFALLADVRNDNGITPICPPRGLPDDISPMVEEEADLYGEDGHSHSWFTVKELLEYDWTTIIKKAGIVSASVYSRWSEWGKKRGDNPESYCQGVYGRQVRVIDEPEMEQLINSNAPDEAFDHLYCRVSWEQPAYKSCIDFLGETMPRLWRVGNPEDVRIVFWFDN